MVIGGRMKHLLFMTMLVTSYMYTVADSSCITADGKSGRCKSIHKCSSLLKLLSNPTPAEAETLKNSFCKFVSKTPWVCCPTETCITPDGALGTCVPVFSCPHVTDMLKPTPTQVAITYIQKSRCGSPEEKTICCSMQTRSGFTAFSGQGGGSCQLTALPPDPGTECCGIDASGDDRIIGGTATTLEEYPWLALIEYIKDNTVKLLCGGALISGKYVLTAAHCVVGPVLNVGIPTNVRLGEFDMSNPEPDCVEVAGGGEDCTDGAESIPIEKIIPYPEYDPDSKLRRHDIAILRLDRIVEYTDFIRPICLPSVDFTAAPPDNLTLYAAGWGAVSDDQGSSNTKQKVGLPFVSLQNCQGSYKVPHRQIQLWNGQLCAGGVNGMDSCRGDSGGPLMMTTGPFFTIVGIVSFGPTPCGMENVAGVYTKIYFYLPWINKHISGQ